MQGFAEFAPEDNAAICGQKRSDRGSDTAKKRTRADEENRTPNLSLTRRVLYQLSYVGKWGLTKS